MTVYIDMLIASLAVLMLLVHSLLLGLATMTLALSGRGEPVEAHNRYLTCFFAATVGLAINLLVLFGMGIAGWIGPAAISLGAIVLFIGAVWVVRTNPIQLSSAISGWNYGDGLLLVGLMLVILVASVHAPGHWDDTMYHLPLAKYYLDHGAIALNEFLRFPLFPQQGNLLLMLGLMLGNELGAQVFATFPLFLVCVGLLGTSLWQTRSLIVGMIAVYFLYRLGPVRDTLGYAYIDNTLALFSWGALLAFAVSVSRGSPGWLFVSGLMAGAAAGSKFFGLVFVALLGVYILLTQKNLKAVILFSVAVILTGVWWYLRSFVISGDPFHPAGGNLFGHYLWDSGDLKLQVSEQATHGVAPVSLDILGALSEVKAEPFLLALASLVIFKLPAALKPVRALFIVYLLFWFFVTQVNRYLSPIYGAGVFLAAFVIYWAIWRDPFSRYFSSRCLMPERMLTVSVGILVIGSVLSKPLKDAAWTKYEWQKQLAAQPGHNLFAGASALVDDHGNRLVQVGFENAIYYFDGQVVGDWFGPGRYRQFFVDGRPRAGLLPAGKMSEVMRDFNANILIVSRNRFSKADRAGYLEYFDVAVEDSHGLVLTRKKT